MSLLCLATGLLSPASARAVPADPIAAGPAFTFRDIRTPTRTGFFIGDRIAVGVLNVTPNPDSGAGGDQTVVVARQGAVEAQLPFFSGALTTQHVNSVPFDPALTGSWEVEITNPTSPNSPLSVFTPSLGPTSEVPFVTDGRMTPDGLTPTITWQRPAGFTPDAVRLFVFDLDRFALDGSALVVHTEDLAGDATAFPLPATLDDGSSLAFGGHYEIAVMMQNLRGDGSVLSRSRTFFAFSPLAGGPVVELPTVGPDGLFRFDLGLDPGERVVLDPAVATGWAYRTGPGDPLFADVTALTDLGIGAYELLYETGGVAITASLLPGTRFTFPAGGVDAFTIAGIDPAVGLDPRLATAFLTEVGFTGGGRFTGSMTPLVVAGAPGTGLLAAWAVLAARSRRREAR